MTGRRSEPQNSFGNHSLGKQWAFTWHAQNIAAIGQSSHKCFAIISEQTLIIDAQRDAKPDVYN
jgi:hypothetical protein